MKSKDRVYDLVFGVKYGQSVRPVFIKVDCLKSRRSAEDIKQLFSDIGELSGSIAPTGVEHIALVVEFNKKIRKPFVRRVRSRQNQVGFRIQEPNLESPCNGFLGKFGRFAETLKQAKVKSFRS